MQIDIGPWSEVGLLRSGRSAPCIIRSRKAAGSSFESRHGKIRGFDQRWRRGDECAAEEYLPRLL